MAKANWLTISPMSGTGNATIRNIGSEHTGRLDRTTTVTGKAVGIASEKTYSVVQHAKSEFVTVNDASYQVAATGGTVTVSGTSNSPLLTVTVDEGGTVGTLTVNGSQATNGQNISGDPGADAQYTWKVQIQVAENPTVNQRSLTVKVQGSSSSIADTIEVVQAASLFTYEYVPSASVPTIAASGGNSVVSAQLKTYRNGSLISTKTVTPTLTGSATGFSISGATVTASNRGTTVGEARSITVTCNYVTSETGETLSDTVTISQAANSRVIVYGKPTITSFEVADIPASGGSVSSGNVEYSQSRHYYYDSGQTEELSPLTTGGQVTFGDAVSAGSLGTTIKNRTIVGQLTCQVAMNGQTSVEGDASVYQQANSATYGDVSLTVTSPVSVDVDGGQYNITASGSQTVSFTSGASRAGSVSLSYVQASAVDGFSLNGSTVTVSENTTTSTKSYTVNVTATGEGSKKTTKQVVFNQADGQRTYSEITVSLSYPQASAAGGTVSPVLTYSQTWGWNGSTTGGGTITSGAQVSYSGTNINASTGVATVASKGTTESGVTTATTATVTVSMNGKTAQDSAAIQQAANSKNEVSRVITVSVPTGDIPAKGGTKTVTRSGVINYSFTSGSTTTSSFTPTLSISGTGFSLNGTTVTAANRSTTVGERRSATVTASYEGATSKTATVYQQENEVVSITYGTPQVVLNVSDIPASGGTVSSGIVNYLQSRTRNYTSGATSRMSSLSSGGVITYSDAVSGANLGTTEKERTKLGTLTATVTMNGKSDSDSADIYQEANVRTAGGITYGDWQVSVYARDYISTSSPCPASGDSFTIYSSASRTRVQEYNYTSGATDTETLSTETATPELSVSGEGGLSLSGNTATYANRGTTEGNLRSNTILATYEGAYDTEQVYQEENVKTAGSISYGTWQVSVSANRYTSSSSPCPAGGGTCTITLSASRTRTQNYSYTSGDTSTEALTNESGTPTLSISGTGASLSGTTVTWANRTTVEGSARSATVTATMDTVTAQEVVYQAKNEYTEEWDNPVVDMQPSSHTISHIGNDWYVDSFSATQSGTRTYDSGSTQSLTNSEFTWSSSENVSWLYSQVEFDVDFCITSDDNEGTTSRIGVVTLTATGKGGKTGSDTITITQEGVSITNYLNVSPTSLTFTATGGTKSITIDTNESWTIS